MCNCNNKRRQFQQRQSAKRRRALSDTSNKRASLKENRIFEYLGTGQLVLQGTNSGTVYRFSRAGARLEVAYSDSFAMMAESELKLVS